ncbi:MAG: ester cyclase [Bacillati bacterium ANGP1]|uniref:Ester cyclase n=1 Tax=Candidatus Segetimicrobium genomatis TaxID=2569760 RepID=A0A537IFW0_9BACT|nr:MAG: ester cyclase [Terrabacteria group bacterium ANGP1]
MSEEENKAIVRRVNDEVWNMGNLEAIDELIADDFVTTVIGAPEQIRGPDGFRDFVLMYRKAFPDLRLTIDDQIAEGETVVTRWTATGTHEGELMGIPPTGKQATTAGININRISGGQLVDGWGIFDQLGLLQQIGAVPVATQV